MTTSDMPQTPALTSSLTNLTTPGSIFLSKKPSFRTKINDHYHYKLENIPNNDQYQSLPNRKRTTMNVTFHQFKNEIDPYVHASNWLPKFKCYCKGYLARKKKEELQKKVEAVKTIQRAAKEFLNPIVQIFHIIRPTLKMVKIDELKKYLRDCIIQIKKLNGERMFIENQLDDVENALDLTLNTNKNNNCLSLEGRKSPNIFGKMSEIKANANNDTFLKECLDLKIDGLENIEVNFDPSSCQNSKIHAVYEKSDKLQLRMHENQHKIKELINKCDSLEKEIKDLRSSNTSLDSTSRIMKGIMHKNDREKDELINKVSDYQEKINNLNEEKKQILSKMKETENVLSERNEMLDEMKNKCDYNESELDKKVKAVNTLNQEKSNLEKKIKELEDTMSYNNDIQQELETNIDLQKTRTKEMKKRLLEQVKATEEDLAAEKISSKSLIHDLNEQNESLQEKLKQCESTIRRLEREINHTKNNDDSEEDIDHERERKLGMQLKTAKADADSLKEELKILENNNEEYKKRNQELENKLEEMTTQETEIKIQIEKYKSQIQTLKSSFNDTELNYNRAVREKNYANQKTQQSKDQITQLEEEITKLKDEIAIQSQHSISKSKDKEVLEEELATVKKEYQSKTSVLQELNYDLQSQIASLNEKLNQAHEEKRRSNEALKQEIEEQKQMLEEKENEQENTLMENSNYKLNIKKLQKRNEEHLEQLKDSEKTIVRLKEENRNLKEESDNQSILSHSEHRSMDYLSAESNLSRSSSVLTSPISSNDFGNSTLPRAGSSRYHKNLLK